MFLPTISLLSDCNVSIWAAWATNPEIERENSVPGGGWTRDCLDDDDTDLFPADTDSYLA
jgi:hypothetical protein